jgi:hypothetical protein
MRGALIEAYVGQLEDDWETRGKYDQYVAEAKGDAVVTYEYWLESEVEDLIDADTPEARLKRYLEWNGIIGYDRSIIAIMKGEH